MNDTWNWRLLRCGAFRLDGGSMFGVVPRVVWSRTVEPDERNRIPLQTNALLLERNGTTVVVELGIGDKFGAKERDIYAMEDRTVLDALHEAGCDAASVGAVVLSHLHFDHAGALTRRPRAGEGEGPVVAFPNARIVTQKQEWEDALANRSTMHKTYLPDHLTPGVKERVLLVDSPDPGADLDAKGFVPTPVPLPGLEGIGVFRVPGHTWGQQAVMFKDARGRTVVFTPDVMPTVNHAGAAYNMAYDVETYTSMRMRMRLLEAATERGWSLAIDHEPGPAVVRVEHDPDKRGAYRLTPDDDHG